MLTFCCMKKARDRGETKSKVLRDRGETKSYSIYMKFQKKQNYSTDVKNIRIIVSRDR